mmetsp:Transcript_91357/g.254413  ORF Transcript_91357/g.254413 Transcript_91357/m.254413 type:complete len:284 (-) Transcript_91357:144-995(-)
MHRMPSFKPHFLHEGRMHAYPAFIVSQWLIAQCTCDPLQACAHSCPLPLPRLSKDEAAKDAAKDEGEHHSAMGCFPGSASVYVKGRGPVRVSEVRPGELLLAGNAQTGRLLFSPFMGHLHREVATRANYVSLEMAGSGATLSVSREHLVFAARSPSGCAAATRAGELCKGDWLCRVSCDGDLSRMQISAVSKASHDGVYCPLTECGTVVVDGTLCSCYTDAFLTTAPPWFRRLAATHQVAHGALFPLRLACRFGWGTKGLDGPLKEGIHPFCRVLMATTQTIA